MHIALFKSNLLKERNGLFLYFLDKFDGFVNIALLHALA